jgi:hypothetical protein
MRERGSGIMMVFCRGLGLEGLFEKKISRFAGGFQLPPGGSISLKVAYLAETPFN